VQKVCEKNWCLGREISMDEIDIGFQGTHKMKERITYKKAGDGFLIYALSDTNGYLFSFNLKFDPNWKKNWFGFTKTFSAVIDLAKRIPSSHKWHHMFYDNLYGNMALAEQLIEMNIECTSTMRGNRIPKVKELVLDPKSAPNTWVGIAKKNVMVVKWMDRKEVKFCTTSHKHFPVKFVNVKKKRSIKDPVTGIWKCGMVDVSVIEIGADYNYNMNGVDLTDQYRVSYNLRIKTKKWWTPLFFWMLETCIVNAYLSYRHYLSSILQVPKKEILSHAEFRAQLAHQLMNEAAAGLSMKKRKRTTKKSPSNWAEERLQQGSHWPVKEMKNSKGNYQARDCHVCKDIFQVKKRSIYYCSACNIPLHPECFARYHTD
jgi:hypothetical protein